MQKITPFLWFDDNAEEAIEFYMSIFKDSEILSMDRVGDGRPGAEGPVTMARFRLEGQEFYALNGGPDFPFTEAISLFVSCEDQAEVDDLWERLSAGGEESRCGWLKDKFGLSWQIVPAALGELMGRGNPEQSKRVMDALLKMDKIIIADLESAYTGS